MAFGGAAPLHASRLAEKLGIARIIVPPDAGVGSAVGFLAAPAAYEIVRSRYMRLSTFDADAANALVGAMQQRGRGAMPAPRPATGRCRCKRSAFMRYAGQGHEITVALPDRKLDRRRCGHVPGRLRARVHAPVRPPHPQRRDRDHELGGAGHHGDRAAGAACRRPPRSPRRSPSASAPCSTPALGRRVTVPIFERASLAPGAALKGPALIVEDGTSTYVSPRFDVAVDAGERAGADRELDGAAGAAHGR